MRRARSIALAMLGIALLWSAPASSANSPGDADGWYKWQVEGSTMSLYLHQENGEPTRIRMFSPDCRLSVNISHYPIKGEIVDLGVLSVDDSVAMLLDIVKEKDLDVRVREDAMFGLAQSDSDTAFEYFDQLLFAQKK